MIVIEDKFLNTVLTLAARAINGTQLTEDEVAAIDDIERLRKFAKFHSIGAMTYFPLEKAGIKDEKWNEIRDKAIRNMILLGFEREKMFNAFTSAGINYMPLKGTLLHKMYPGEGMREMADTDVLIDVEKEDDARKIMEGLGYNTVAYAVSVHDVYRKPPIFDVELHTALFGENYEAAVADYYDDVWERLLKRSEDSTEYRFTDEDFYVYMIAHMSKHLAHSGTGIRSLADIYVYLNANPGIKLDEAVRELEKMGLSEGERLLRSLSLKIFSEDMEALTDDESELLSEILASGTYGTVRQSVSKQLTKIAGGEEKINLRTKIKFVFKRLFPGSKHIKAAYPVCNKHPILVPYYTVVRLTKLITKRKSIKGEIKALNDN